MIEKPPYKPQPVKYIAYKELDAVDTAVLIKPSAFNRLSIERYYFRGVVDTSRIIVASLEYGADNKVNNKIMEPVMEQLLTELNSLGVKVIYVADAKYFNYITKLKVTNCIGTIVPCKLKGFEHFKVIAGINYQALVHQPTQASLLDISVNTLHQHLEGFDVAKAKDIIKDALYITNPKQYSIIESQLYKLLHEPKLAVDIECAGDEDKDALRFNKSELTSIAFATNDSDGIAIYIDNDKKIKAMLKKFFIDFTHKTIYHNGLFDIKTLIYHLFMEDSSDIEGMFYGIDVMTRNIEDTQVLTYLCTNNVQENKLGLKHNVLEYTGQYAEDVSDVKKLSVDDLLTYNLKDTLATFWLWQKRNYELDIENQRDIYENLFMPSFKALLESMLVGLPMDMNVVDKVKEKLESELVKVEQIFTDSKIIQEFNQELQTQAMIKANAKLKTKVKPISDFKHILFNPGSALQKVQLLYTKFSLPVLDYTKKKQPAVGKKTLDKLLFHVKDPEVKQIIEALVDYADITKILSTFIGAFEKFAFTRNDGTVWLNGAQILCGTVSGRLASREPNLANLPSNSKYGKLIKSCFVAPKGWLFAGADFSALEDRIVAILSDDPMKKKPFTEGIDGHCLNAFGYFKHLMPDINNQNINDIKKLYPDLRQDSKAPTFALNYNGTWMTLVKNCGFSEESAKSIEAGHKDMYHVLHSWNQVNKDFMVHNGYVECAFGLKVRTPLLAKSIKGGISSFLDDEFRSANNAKTQSWGLLTTRAAKEFRKRLSMSKFRDRVVIVNFIHDAIYLLVYDELEVIEWVNNTLIECMEWQEHPSIKSDEIKLTAELDIGYSWDKMVTLPNRISQTEIATIRGELDKKE